MFCLKAALSVKVPPRRYAGLHNYSLGISEVARGGHGVEEASASKPPAILGDLREGSPGQK